jgi:hypothetical protein
MLTKQHSTRNILYGELAKLISENPNVFLKESSTLGLGMLNNYMDYSKNVEEFYNLLTQKNNQANKVCANKQKFDFNNNNER